MEETNEVIALTYVPRYVKQEANYEYGDTLTHEAYNQLINVNSAQGDYNTEVLDILFNSEDSTYKIKYVDKKFQDIDSTVSDVVGDVADVIETLTQVSNKVDAIEDGTQTVAHATVADNLAGLVDAGANKYYGTNANAQTGFYDVPDNIYYEDINTAVGIDVINIVPAPASVTETMLTQEVQTKLNRQQGVTDYDYLSNRPSINHVLLTGDVSIADLGIQEAGDFVTNTDLGTTLASYVTDTDLSTILNSYVTNTTLNSTVTDINSSIATRARVGVNTAPANPVAGDLYITVS